MATIKHNLLVEDPTGSIKRRTKDVQDLGAALDKVKAKGVSAAFARNENTAYGQTRGMTGSTGASARDFANEAQGLGGLVRLYATYAANVFAVSAAFTALSNAMDTTMMVRGLDQLGAASGVALGGLARNFAAASDGAISFREAMQATAQATSAGLSKKQFMELGQVAKSASQALGVNMSDAVNRLTRGITKLEPELLDELGLFTKVGKASENYARSVGKSVEQLTDFEKRQAFANAVLKEGRDKFSEIAAEGNPFDRLLASLKNTAQSILEVVNTVVAPIATLLANNVELIGLAIGLAAMKITKQALPALTQWRGGLKDAADDAVKRAEDMNTRFGEAFVSRAQERAKIPQIQGELDAMKNAYAERAKLFLTEESQLKKNSAISQALASGEILTKRQLGSIQAEITRKQNDTNEATKRHVSGLRDILTLQSNIVGKTDELVKANDIVEAQASKRSRFLSSEWQREQAVINARAKAANLSLLSTVSSRVEEQGLFSGVRSFYSDVSANKDLSRFQKLKTAAVGTFTGMATAAGILGAALSRVMVFVEIALVAFTVLNAVFSKNGKAARELNNEIDILAESTKTAADVTKKYKDTISFASINASANAFTNLSEGIATAGAKFEKFIEQSSGWDRFIEGVKSITGSDMKTKLSEGVANSIISGIALVPEGEQRQALEANLRKSLGSQELTFESITKALEAYSKAGIVTKTGEIEKILQGSGRVLRESQAITQEVENSGKAAQQAFLTFQNSVFAASPMQAFLTTTYQNALALEKAFKDVGSQAATFGGILKGEVNLNFLPIGVSEQIQKMATVFKTAGKDLQKQLAEGAAKLIGDSINASLEYAFKEFRIKMRQVGVESQRSAMALLPIRTEESINRMYQLEVQSIKLDAELRKTQESLILSIDRNTAQLEANRAAGELQALVQTPIPFGAAEQEARNANILSAGQSVIRANKINQAIQSGRIGSLTEEEKRDPAIRRMMLRQQGTSLIDRQTEQRIGAADQNRAKQLLDLDFENRKKLLDFQLKELNNEFDLRKKGAQDDATRAALELERLQKVLPKELELAQLPVNQQLGMAGLAAKYGVDPKVIESQAKQLGLDLSRITVGTTGTQAATTAGATRESAIAEAKKASESNIRVLEREGVLAQEKFAKDKDIIALGVLDLEQRRARGVLTDEQFIREKVGLDLKDATLERDAKISEGYRTQQRELEALEVKKAEANGTMTEALKQELDAINLRAQVTETAAQREFNARKRVGDQDLQNANRLTVYQDSFRKIFDGMADVIINFAKTGKLEFESLISSMIEGLIRYELQLQTTALYAAVRPGLGQFLTTVLGMTGSGGGGGGVNYSLSSGSNNLPSMGGGQGLRLAQGGAFDYGIQAFAKGGAFTNSIVDSPTLFKFAKGTGLMGEAGPEAIMPLKRDGQGNLGVRTDGSAKTEVVINNYSGEPAEAKEVVDSRGNRKIEVVIGDMTAGEVGRSGSLTQRSIKNTFGIQPQLIRR